MLYSQITYADQGRYVVAKSGGDFTTITEALALGSNCTNNPVVIDIMPGLYRENLNLTGFNACTHLRGSGMGLTTILGTGGTTPVINTGIQCAGCGTPQTIMVSGVTVQGNGGQDGVFASYGTLTLSDSRVTNTGTAVGSIYGTAIVRNSVIERNVTGASTSYGALHLESNKIIMNSGTGVFGALNVVDNLIQGNRIGIWINSQPHANASANISGNTITQNSVDGMYISSMGTLVIKDNKITNNGNDINARWQTNINTTLAFNTYDTINPANVNKVYNINSAGVPWPNGR